jgi:hypothetical protein
MRELRYENNFLHVKSIARPFGHPISVVAMYDFDVPSIYALPI